MIINTIIIQMRESRNFVLHHAYDAYLPYCIELL